MSVFFETYAWVAAWTTLLLVSITEVSILYLLLRYLRRFLGRLTPDQIATLGKRLGDLAGSQTTAERVLSGLSRSEEEGEARPDHLGVRRR